MGRVEVDDGGFVGVGGDVSFGVEEGGARSSEVFELTVGGVVGGGGRDLEALLLTTLVVGVSRHHRRVLLVGVGVVVGRSGSSLDLRS